jgi:hypothetical protein
MKKGGSSPSKADLMNRDAICRFVAEVQRHLRRDVSLAEAVVSVVLNDHFPDSIHEDIGQARPGGFATRSPKLNWSGLSGSLLPGKLYS